MSVCEIARLPLPRFKSSARFSTPLTKLSPPDFEQRAQRCRVGHQEVRRRGGVHGLFDVECGFALCCFVDAFGAVDEIGDELSGREIRFAQHRERGIRTPLRILEALVADWPFVGLLAGEHVGRRAFARCRRNAAKDWRALRAVSRVVTRDATTHRSARPACRADRAARSRRLWIDRRRLWRSLGSRASSLA